MTFPNPFPVRQLWLMVLAVSYLLAAGKPASAYIAIAMQPIPETIVIADVVAIGKITAREPKTLNGKIYPDGNGRWDFAIYELTPSTVIKGKAAKTFRVGVPQIEYHKKPMKIVENGETRLLNPEVQVGAEGTFLLIKHCELDMYVLPTIGGFLVKTEPGYEKENSLLRRCAKLLEKPEDGLGSKEKEDRFLTAYMLLYEYGMKDGRKSASKGMVEEPIDPKLSKRILQVMLEADWSVPEKVTATGPLSTVRPQNALPWLKLDAASLKKRPKLNFFDQAEYATLGRQWLTEINETAQLHRLVAPAKEKNAK